MAGVVQNSRFQYIRRPAQRPEDEAEARTYDELHDRELESHLDLYHNGPATKVNGRIAGTFIPSGAWTAVRWETELWNTHTEAYSPMFDSTADARLTCFVQGLYTVKCAVTIEDDTTGWRGLRVVRYNSAGVAQDTDELDIRSATASAGIPTTFNGSTEFNADELDFFQVEVQHNVGGGLTVTPGSQSFFLARLVRAQIVPEG